MGTQHSGLGRRARKHTGTSGYHFLHTALDYHSGLVCTEVLVDEQPQRSGDAR